MAGKSNPRLREVYYQIHLWSGIVAALLLVPICLTGSYLVWHIPIDAALNPERQVEGDSVPMLAPEQYIDAAASAFPGTNPGMLAMPPQPGTPVNVVMLSPEQAARGAQQHRIFVWMHPADGRILDTNDSNRTFIAWAHRFHFYLSAHPVIGRQIVGISGILLTISCLTSLFLWLSRPSGLWREITWQRRQKTSRNLHFVFGFWITAPMLVLALSGIYLSFPDASKRLVGAFTTIREPIPLAEPVPSRALADLRLSPAEAIQVARSSAGEDTRVARLAMPSAGSDEWVVFLANPEGPMPPVLVNDVDGSTSRPPAPLPPAAGDRFSRLMHAMHDGQTWGLLYQTIIFVAGLLPLLFAITGVMLWLRRRKIRARGKLARATA